MKIAHKPLTTEEDVAIQVKSLTELGERVSKSRSEAIALLKRIGSRSVQDLSSKTVSGKPRQKSGTRKIKVSAKH